MPRTYYFIGDDVPRYITATGVAKLFQLMID